VSFLERSSKDWSPPSASDVAREHARVQAERFDLAQAALTAARLARDDAVDHLRRARRATAWTAVPLALCAAQLVVAIVHSALRLNVLNATPLWVIGLVGTVALTLVLLCVIDHYSVERRVTNRARRAGVDVSHVAPVVALRDREAEYEAAQNAVLNAVTGGVDLGATSYEER
jgi:hypothetical protein